MQYKDELTQNAANLFPGCFLLRLALSDPADRFDALSQRAAKLSLDCSIRLLDKSYAKDDVRTTELEVGRLQTSLALQLISDHVKHYPEMEPTAAPHLVSFDASGTVEPLSLSKPDVIFQMVEGLLNSAKQQIGSCC